MSQTQTPKITKNNFTNPESLSNWLKSRLPTNSLSNWGTLPGTKNLHNLYLELIDGETTLTDTTPPIRKLQVVSVKIKGHNNTKQLIESHQELSDWSLIERNRPLSEKMKAGESVECAAKRGIKEELGSILCDIDGKEFDEIVKIGFESYERRIEERDSCAYPDLLGCYVFHCVDAIVEGLPQDEFETMEGDEYEEIDQGVLIEAFKVMKHFWKWVDVENVYCALILVVLLIHGVNI